MTNSCDWHKGDRSLEEDETPGCCNCGRLIDTKICEGCGEEFYDWDSESADDVMAPPGVTSSGDFYCRPCARRMDAEEERMLEEEWWIEDFPPGDDYSAENLP